VNGLHAGSVFSRRPDPSLSHTIGDVPTPASLSRTHTIKAGQQLATRTRLSTLDTMKAILASTIATGAVVAALLSLPTATTAVDISSTSLIGQRLLQQATPLNHPIVALSESSSSLHQLRWLNEQDNNNADYSYIAEYSIKFQGCHHVQQWNDNVDEDSDVRIMTKRLARFRLCPSDQCSNDKSSGCSSKYGDYVVDVRVQCVYAMDLCFGVFMKCC
jgi:hypothetical protein